MKSNLFTAVCLVVFASPLAADTGDALFLQSYSFPDLDKAIQAVSITDDFIPYTSGSVQFVYLWMLLISGQPEQLSLNVTVDAGDINPNTSLPYYTGVSQVTFVDTGDVLSGYPVMEATCVLPYALPLTAGNRYWLQINIPAGGYWLAQQPLVFGSTMWVYNAGEWISTMDLAEYDADGFFELYTPVALERNSWGSIKAFY
jgi:hypothetical protein